MNRRVQNPNLQEEAARQEAAIARIPTANQGSGMSVDEYINLITVQRAGKGTQGQVLRVNTAHQYLEQRNQGRPSEHL